MANNQYGKGDKEMEFMLGEESFWGLLKVEAGFQISIRVCTVS